MPMKEMGNQNDSGKDPEGMKENEKPKHDDVQSKQPNMENGGQEKPFRDDRKRHVYREKLDNTPGSRHLKDERNEETQYIFNCNCFPQFKDVEDDEQDDRDQRSNWGRMDDGSDDDDDDDDDDEDSVDDNDDPFNREGNHRRRPPSSTMRGQSIEGGSSEREDYDND
ncbi:hypothetical protein Aperf_G00000005152 [Anoplocephala perfoliata]